MGRARQAAGMMQRVPRAASCHAMSQGRAPSSPCRSSRWPSWECSAVRAASAAAGAASAAAGSSVGRWADAPVRRCAARRRCSSALASRRFISSMNFASIWRVSSMLLRLSSMISRLRSLLSRHKALCMCASRSCRLTGRV